MSVSLLKKESRGSEVENVYWEMEWSISSSGSGGSINKEQSNFAQIHFIFLHFVLSFLAFRGLKILL